MNLSRNQSNKRDIVDAWAMKVERIIWIMTFLAGIIMSGFNTSTT